MVWPLLLLLLVLPLLLVVDCFVFIYFRIFFFVYRWWIVGIANAPQGGRDELIIMQTEKTNTNNNRVRKEPL